jgi:amino acid transporter
MAENDGKISRTALLAMVVGGMVGAGIFSLPRTFANATGPIGAIIAWVIAGTGMYMLARVFQFLGERKPHLDAGVFAYAKEGFGNYPGFLSAFGYWIGSCIGNVSYWVLIKSTLGAFFPVFGDGNTVVAIVVASIGIWAFHFMILRGTQQAAAINKIVTIAKVIPILVFIVILIFAFKMDLFSFNLYGGDLKTGVFEQVKATMLVTVFVSVGLIVSVLGAYLAWSLICAEVLSVAAKTKDMPSVFAKENQNKVPANALWMTNIIEQLIVITTYWSRDAFSLMLNLTSAMALIPFLLCAGYAWMMVSRGETYDTNPEGRTRDLVIAILATLYTAFLVYAGGLKFVVLSAVLYGPGTALYFWCRREQGLPVFEKASDWIIFILAMVGAVVGIYWIATGYIQI